MPLFPSDFKKFKHVSSDKDSTTLRHDKGHELKIAHKALSPKMRTQLEALACGGKVKMAEGEEVSKPRTGSEESFKAMDERDKQRYGQSYQAGPKNDGTDVRTPEQKAKAAEVSKQYGYAEGGPVKAYADPSEEVSAQDSAPVVDDSLTNHVGQLVGKYGVGPLVHAFESVKDTVKSSDQRDEEMGKALNQGVSQFTQGVSKGAGMAPAQEQTPQVESPAQPQIEQPAAPQQPSPLAAQQSQVQPNPGMTEQGLTESAYRKQNAGLNANVAAITNEAKERQGVIAADQLARQGMQDKYAEDFNALEAERQNLRHDIESGHIDPEQYWTGDKNGNGSHSKLMAGIGMIIAGFNPTNSPNAAINYIQHQMDKNIEAQKANLDSKHNLLASNLKQFGNLKDATDMTKVFQADMVKSKLELAATNAASPLAKAAALQAAGQLDAIYAPLVGKIAAKVTLNKLMAQGSKDPKSLPAMIDAIAAVDPEKAKDLRGRLVPDIGIANTSEGAKDMREMHTTVETVKQAISRLKEMTKQSGKSMSPALRAEADTIRSTLIGRLRVPLTGPGAMSEGERALLEKAIPDVTSMFSLDSSNVKRLDTLEKTIVTNYQNMAKANGLESAGIQMSPNQVERKTPDGRTAIFDANSKKFLGYK